ncbi:MAG TPA: PEP-CTERM sorting domain-containing protein [Nodularia sp. (in: cyanobacteria)]|nr:PEP-CTERM sorting domain-containing protein [Nodularia sp. (in: cyanobacteria)]
MTTTAFLKNLAMATTTATCMVLGSVASAQAITIGGVEYTLGEQIFSTGGNVEAKILQGNPNASFTSDLRLFISTDPNGAFTPIGTTQEVGKTVNLGIFPSGQELFFGIYVPDTNNTYFLGSADRNPDNKIYAGLATIAPGVINATFEDSKDEVVFTYDDVQFQVIGAISTNPQSVPEPTTFLGVLLVGGVGISKLKFNKKALDD